MWKCFVIGIAISCLFFLRCQNAPSVQQPNILLIMADDQGYGDLGSSGNPLIHTPHLDALAHESVRFTHFHVSPVCAPTRSSLMTGRYSLRTGIRDTYNGGAIMSTEEITIAEMLGASGYATGVFGKWHLGDNYPSRPQDQGFDESLIHLSGGMAQVGDFTTWFQGDSAYFNPVLWHNGQQQHYQGYCTDVFTDAALEFIEKQQSPWLCYLAYNAPHTPLQVPDRYYQLYQDVDPASGFPADQPFPRMSEKDKEDARRVYAMVTCIDDNVGRLLAKLEALNLTENTIVVFMTDNGPQQQRYLAGMRGLKGSVYRGGTRVPFFFRYPGKVAGNRDIDALAAHLDVLPTLAAITGASVPDDRPIDGRSLWPLLQNTAEAWQDRPYFSYWTRRYPEKYNNIALEQGVYKLVGHADYDAPIDSFELFNIRTDPYELKNIISTNRPEAEKLKKALDSTYRELIQSDHLVHQPPIIIGDSHENPVYLNRNDADGERGIWAQSQVYGRWNVEIRPGNYDISFRFLDTLPAGRMVLEAGTDVWQKESDGHSLVLELKDVEMPAFKGSLIPFYACRDGNLLPFWVELKRTK